MMTNQIDSLRVDSKVKVTQYTFMGFSVGCEGIIKEIEVKPNRKPIFHVADIRRPDSIWPMFEHEIELFEE